MDVPYHFQVRVILPSRRQKTEVHTVNESDSQFGQSVAMGKVVRYYEQLREQKKIIDYRFLF